MPLHPGLAIPELSGRCWALALPLLPGLLFASPPSKAGKPIPIGPGAALEQRLGDGENHRYLAELDAGPWLIAARQRGIDVTLVLTGPDGVRLGPFDSPVGRRGTEAVLLTMDRPGPVNIEVLSRPGAVTGRYTLRITALDDPSHVTAETEISRAGRLMAEDTPAARHDAQEHYRRAVQLWREARQAGAGAPSPVLAGEARALTAAAALARRLSGPQEAARLYREALELWRALDDREAEAAVTNRLGLTLNDLGESQKALKLFEQAVNLWRALGEPRAEALVRNNLCLGQQRQGRLEAARACYEATRALFRQLDDPVREVLVVSNLAGVYWKLGEPTRAEELYRIGLEQSRERGDSLNEARALSHRALLYQQLGEAEQALADAGQALEVFRRLGERRRVGRMLGMLGATYFELGELERARAILEEALPVRREVGDRRGVADSLRFLGRIYRGQGESAAAFSAWGEALTLAQELDDRRGMAATLELAGQAHAEDGSFRRALPELGHAVELQQQIGNRRQEATARLRLAEAHRRMGDAAGALTLVDEALKALRAIRDPGREVQALEILIRAERDLGQTHRALRAAGDARDLLADLRTRAGGAGQRAAFLASRRGIYELSIELLMDLHRREPEAGHDRRAFEVSESGRSRVLLDLVSETATGVGRSLDEALRQRLRAAEHKLTATAERRLQAHSRKSDPEKTASAERAYYHALRELEEARAEARRRSPRYAALSRPETLNATEAARLLDPETLLLEVALGEERGVLWALTADSFESFLLPGRQRIEELARRAYRDLSILDLTIGTPVSEALATLGELFLHPIDKLLSRTRRVVVVADGALHYVPFAALPRTNTARTGEAREEPNPLLVSHEVVHLPSASALALLRQPRARPPGDAGKTLAVLADPVFDPDDPRLNASKVAEPDIETEHAPVSRALESSRLAGLDRLPATRREAETIAAMVEPEERWLALGFDADRARVMAGELTAYRYLHFATHGLSSSHHPELSGLVLSRLDAAGRRQTGFLSLHDVYSLQLSAELVVLSGCQTALGKEIRGEGLVGLTRGFLWAGVPRVVASLWQVRDDATAELMARFYRVMLEDGSSPAAALRAAQLSVRAERKWAAPFFWAAFVFEGDWYDI